MNPVIQKQISGNSQQNQLRNEKNNDRSISPTYNSVKNQNSYNNSTEIALPSQNHSNVPVRQNEGHYQRIDQQLTQSNMKEIIEKSGEQSQVQSTTNVSKGQKSSKSRSPLKIVNPQPTYKKITQKLPKQAQKTLTEISSRSQSNNHSQHSSSFSKVHNQSFKSTQTPPQILKKIYQHKRNNLDIQVDNNNYDEVNQTTQDETLESFYKDVEKNKKQFLEQRGYSSVSPVQNNRKSQYTSQRNNQNAHQVSSQIQDSIKTNGTSPNSNKHSFNHQDSPSKNDVRKKLYEQYSQEQINQILHKDYDGDRDGSYHQNSESRKPSPLFGVRNEQINVTMNNVNFDKNKQFMSHLTDSPAETFQDQKKVNGQTNNHQKTSQSSFQFIGKLKQLDSSKSKTQMTSLTKFMKKMNNDQYQGSSQLYQQLQKSQKIAQEQMKNLLISPARKNQFFGQKSTQESFVVSSRKDSQQKDRTPEKVGQGKTPSNKFFVVKGNKSNCETPRNGETITQKPNENVSYHKMIQKQSEQLKSNIKQNSNSNTTKNQNSKIQQQDLKKQKESQIDNGKINIIQANQEQINQIQQQISMLNQQNQLKDQKIEQLNNQVQYLIEQISRQSQQTNQNDIQTQNNRQSFKERPQDKQNSYRQQNSSSSNGSMKKHDDLNTHFNEPNRNSDIYNLYFQQESQYKYPSNQVFNNQHQSPSSMQNSCRSQNHQKQISFSMHQENQNGKQNNGFYTDRGYNNHNDYFSEHLEKQNRHINDKRCKTLDVDYSYNHSEKSHPSQHIKLTQSIMNQRRISADNYANSKNHQDYPPDHLMYSSLNQNKIVKNPEDTKHQNDFEVNLVESIVTYDFRQQKQQQNRQSQGHENGQVQMVNSQYSARRGTVNSQEGQNSHRESYKTPNERFMQQQNTEQDENSVFHQIMNSQEVNYNT